MTTSICGYLIDPFEQEISEVKLFTKLVKDPDFGEFYDLESINTIYELIKCGIFTAARVYPNNDIIYVDDMGLLQHDQHYFLHSGYNSPLAGRGLLLGTGNFGESISPATPIETVKEDITWLGNVASLHSKLHGI